MKEAMQGQEVPLALPGKPTELISPENLSTSAWYLGERKTKLLGVACGIFP